MKRSSMFTAAALAAALAAGALAGCTGQSSSTASSATTSSAASSAPASSAAASSAAATSSASSTQAASSADAAFKYVEGTQEELIAMLKDAIAKMPAVKSVTVQEEERATLPVQIEYSSGSSASSESSASSSSAIEPTILDTVAVYKFDETGDKVKSSMTSEVGGIKMSYYTEGDQAVLVSDGTAYSGTTEQFGVSHAGGFKEYITGEIGDLNMLADCAANIEVMTSSGLTFYVMDLDPQKYTKADEALGILAEIGDPLTESRLALGFDEDGTLASVDFTNTYEQGNSKEIHLMPKDYDSTTVDPMPTAEKTYEDMEAEVKAQVDGFVNQIANEVSSSQG